MSKRMPAQGQGYDALFARMQEARANDVDWRRGRLPLYVYFAGEDVERVARDAYAMFMQESGHSPSAFPSIKQFEDDVIAMMLDLLHGDEAASGDMTLGGTESVFMAVKAARDWAREHRPAPTGVPEIVAPHSAHPCVNKAAEYLGLKVTRVALGKDHRADLAAMAAAAGADTFMLYGSAPCWPHGVFDPIAGLGALAQERNLWFHVDACLGGMITPFASKLGRPVPAFDFAVPGVTSISVDLHKFGFVPKGASCLLLKDGARRKYQLFEFTDWPRGLYASPSFVGTRPGGQIAAAWAVMNYLGEAGYLRAVDEIMRTTDRLVAGIEDIAELEICNAVDLNIVTFLSPTLDIANIAAGMHERQWFSHLGGEPPTMHFMVNPVHEPHIEAYLQDLAAVVAAVRAGHIHTGGFAVYSS